MNLILYTFGGVFLGLAIAGAVQGIMISLGIASGAVMLWGAIVWVIVSIIGLILGLMFQFRLK